MTWLLDWSNLIFVAPFGVALLYLGVYTLTGVDFGHDADADAGHDGGGGDGHDGHVSGHGHGAGHTSPYAAALTWLGIGRVPLSLIVVVLFMSWGAAGVVTNSFRRPAVGWEAAKVSIPVALAVGLVVTRAMTMFFARFVPLNETYAKPRRDLVGRVGEAVYAIDQTFGMASVRDAGGDLHQVACRVADGVEPIAKGARVKLVAYEGQDRTFYVSRVDG